MTEDPIGYRPPTVFVARQCLVAAVSLGLLTAGCGGGVGRVKLANAERAAQKAKVEQTVRIALADLANGDGPGFCALATSAVRAQLIRAAPGYSCVALVDAVGRHLSAPHKEGLLHVQVRSVAIDGPTATVSDSDLRASEGSLQGFLDDGGKPTRLALQPDGRWKLSG
ncbi:MAG: hypothetical protein WAL63_06380 [Solirubrobacteraceae bacterium]